MTSSPSLKKLALFDIDGTILNAPGAGDPAFVQALENVFGRRVSDEGYVSSGKTDMQIVIELMERAGVEREETLSKLDAVWGYYIEGLRDVMARREPEVCPGIPELLERLSHLPEVVVGLLTGNVERGAEIKVRRVGLWDYFRTGAFGDQAPERRVLPGIAQQAAEQATGRRFEGKDIVIIGDTPNDILCGQDLSVKAIAVATGRYSSEALAEYKPDYLFEDLGDTEGVIEAILM